jgi:NAD(P)-dependent dehydrogenase (short-subunit alcohol dehydrogenase family)
MPTTTNKVAIATGASRGIGRGIAVGLGEVFNRRLVTALATDPQVIEKTGQALDITVVANEFGLMDVDGRRPAPLQ